MCGNDGRDAVTGATRGIWDPLPPTMTAVRVRVRVRIAIMHIVLRCRTGSLSCCLEVDFGVEVATWSCPRGLELLVGSGSWWWAMVHRAQI